MENFRQFEVGPDPFGRNWSVLLKWLQTAISLRHSDTVDVKFVLTANGDREEKTIALPHPALLELSRKLNRELTDPWCARLAAAQLKKMVETGEDIDKDLVTLTLADLEQLAAAVK